VNPYKGKITGGQPRTGVCNRRTTRPEQNPPLTKQIFINDEKGQNNARATEDALRINRDPVHTAIGAKGQKGIEKGKTWHAKGHRRRPKAGSRRSIGQSSRLPKHFENKGKCCKQKDEGKRKVRRLDRKTRNSVRRIGGKKNLRPCAFART